MRFPRASGILLHPTSLPGRFGIGDLGPEAYRFVDFLEAAGQRVWQVLPLGPTPWACVGADPDSYKNDVSSSADGVSWTQVTSAAPWRPRNGYTALVHGGGASVAKAMKYAVVIEKGADSYAAYVPDLPGCIAVGDTFEEVERLIREAIALHIQGIREDGLPVPEPSTRCEYIEA